MVGRRVLALVGVGLVGLAGCGSGHHTALAPSTSTTGTHGKSTVAGNAAVQPTTTSTSTTTAPPSLLSAQVCRDYASFVEVLRGAGDPAGVASGQLGGMVQEAKEAVSSGAKSAADRRLVADLQAVVTLVGSKSWTGAPAMAELPPLEHVSSDCSKITAG